MPPSTKSPYTNESLEDLGFDVEAFLTGDGLARPRGLLTYDPVANAKYAWGAIGYVPSGAAAPSSTPASTTTSRMP